MRNVRIKISLHLAIHSGCCSSEGTGIGSSSGDVLEVGAEGVAADVVEVEESQDWTCGWGGVDATDIVSTKRKKIAG